jgi:hypothetical protein
MGSTKRRDSDCMPKVQIPILEQTTDEIICRCQKGVILLRKLAEK